MSGSDVPKYLASGGLESVGMKAVGVGRVVDIELKLRNVYELCCMLCALE